METTVNKEFMYPYWMKILGILLVLASLAIFLYRMIRFDIVDISAASSSVAAGLIMIYFSRGKKTDERLVYLKFKSLGIAIPVAAGLVLLINYIVNFNKYAIDAVYFYSLSAFEYLSLALVIALLIYHYLKDFR